MPVLPRALVFLGALITLTTTTYLIRPIRPWETPFPSQHVPPPRPRGEPAKTNIPLPFRKRRELILNGNEDVKRFLKMVDVLWWLELHFGPWRPVKHRDPRVNLRVMDISAVMETSQPWWMNRRERRRREKEEAAEEKRVNEPTEEMGEVEKA